MLYHPHNYSILWAKHNQKQNSETDAGTKNAVAGPADAARRRALRRGLVKKRPHPRDGSAGSDRSANAASVLAALTNTSSEGIDALVDASLDAECVTDPLSG